MRRKKTKDEFISDCKNVHGNNYDYSLVEYLGDKIKVKIICDKHGIFEQKPNCHLSGRRCPKCFGKIKKSLNVFIENCKNIHGDNYDYSLVDYINNHIKVKIVCKSHGIFEQIPSHHLKGVGCRKCKPNCKMSKDEFISKSIKYHGDRYDYSKVEYKNSHSKVEILCRKHGSFKQAPYKHIQKSGCPSCKLSKGILKIINVLESKNIRYNLESSIENCLSRNGKLLRFDIHLFDYNCYIEYDGEQHFRSVDVWGGKKSFLEGKERDNIKDNFCKTNNIRLFRISYMDDIESKLNDLLFEISI